jgi:hypothetical protein
MERSEGEEEGRPEGGGSPGPTSDERRENGDRAEAPEDGGQLPRPIGGRQELDRAGDQVVELRVDSVELERFPEERPIPLNPVGLKDLIQAVGEVVEPVEADGGRKNENRREYRVEPLPVDSRPAFLSVVGAYQSL